MRLKSLCSILETLASLAIKQQRRPFFALMIFPHLIPNQLEKELNCLCNQLSLSMPALS